MSNPPVYSRTMSEEEDHLKCHRRRREVGEKEEESEGLVERKAARRFVTAGDLVVINQRERETYRESGERERTRGEQCEDVGEAESKEVVHGGWSVCVCVFVDSGDERHNSDCLVSEVRFSEL